ncbi:MAG: hypothetical protein ICV83_02505 [Cytophagales bacterium]|nr:hypothetical protein [Cytophagales bacterium]
MNFESIRQYLNELSERYGLVEEATKSCLQLMDESWAEKGIAAFGGFAKEELKLAFDRQELVFNHYCSSQIIIRTRIGIYVADPANVWIRSLEPVGYYELDTDEEGQAVDDWFGIEEEKSDELNVAAHLRTLNAHLPEGALRRNSVYYEYLGYVHHTFALYQSQQYDAAAHCIRRAFTYLHENQKEVAGKPYFKESRWTLKMILRHLVEKGWLTPALVEQLTEAGVIRKKLSR